MKTISEEPHHAGSANSRKVAEYILAKFKEFELDARIEEFEALMPYPKERVVEMIQPTHFRLQLKSRSSRKTKTRRIWDSFPRSTRTPPMAT